MAIRIGRTLAAGVLALAVSLSGCSGCGGAADRAELSSSGTRTKETTKSGDTETETSGAHAPGDTAKESAASQTSVEGGTSGKTETTAGTTAGTTAAANSTTAAPAATTAKAPAATTAAPATAHEHSWVAQYQTVTVVDQEAYDETVVDQAAYDEPIYETHMICRGCGGYLDSMTQDERDAHAEAHALAGQACGWYDGQVQTGIIHHDAVTHTVHHDAVTHTEQQLTGYKCSTCGATK